MMFSMGKLTVVLKVGPMDQKGSWLRLEVVGAEAPKLNLFACLQSKGRDDRASSKQALRTSTYVAAAAKLPMIAGDMTLQRPVAVDYNLYPSNRM